MTVRRWRMGLARAPAHSPLRVHSTTIVFEGVALAKGSNRTAEFLDNPFTAPFGKSMAALDERKRCRSWLKQPAYKNDASIPKRLEAAEKALVPTAVKHTLPVEAAP